MSLVGVVGMLSCVMRLGDVSVMIFIVSSCLL